MGLNPPFECPTFDIFCISCGARCEWTPNFKTEAKFSQWYGNFIHTRFKQRCPSCRKKSAIVFGIVDEDPEADGSDFYSDFYNDDCEDFGDEFR